MECGDKEWQHCRVEKMGCPGCYYDEIKIGEYVRTYEGTIGRICRYFKDTDVYQIHISMDYAMNRTLKDIKKHSKNITDLIEVGDILKIEEDDEIAYIGLEKDTTIIAYQDIIDEIKNNKIKLLAIVTKEQFRNIEYKIKE